MGASADLHNPPTLDEGYSVKPIPDRALQAPGSWRSSR